MTGSATEPDRSRHPLWWTPNALTLVRLALAPGIFWLLAVGGGTELALILFALAGVLDFLDGRLARALGAESPFGQFWDPIADKVVVAAALVGLTAMSPGWALIPPAAAIVTRDVAVTLARLVAPTIRAPSFLAKIKTTLEFAALLALLAAGTETLQSWGLADALWQVGLGGVWAAAGLSVWTGATYAHTILRGENLR